MAITWEDSDGWQLVSTPFKASESLRLVIIGPDGKQIAKFDIQNSQVLLDIARELISWREPMFKALPMTVVPAREID